MLETGSMRAPLAALDTCIDNLLVSWGVDVEKHKALSKQVEPLQSPGKWVVASDYPSNMLSAGQPALVNFRLSVGTDGVPTACHIQLTTRPKEFDNAVCKSVMRRARFSPALDATGQPLQSYYQNVVRFEPR
jgi:outer membrane biosynthesis protein TonB